MKWMVVLILFIGSFTTAQVKWMTMNEALEAQKKEPKKILLKAYTNTCPNCKWMEKHAFSKPEIAAFINENYYPVKFDVEGTETINYKGAIYSNPMKDRYKNSQHEFAGFMRIFEYPTLVFFDETGRIINPVPGKMGPKKLEVYITMLADETYKSINTGPKWANYQSNFNYQLQDETN